MNVPQLFTNYQLGGLELPNRIVMAPMTRSRVTGDDALSSLNADYYSQRATAGLIISEAIVVNPSGRGYMFTPGLYSPQQVEGCRKVADAVHKAGGRIVAQLWHVGRVAHESVLPAGETPVAPTGDPVDGLYVFGLDAEGRLGKVHVTPPRAMTEEDIEGTINSFAQAANNAKTAGFDGVEILAANGYLFDQFLNSVVNRRPGRFGGATVTSRCELLLQTIDAIRTAVGREFILGVRLSPFGNFNKMPSDPLAAETFLHLANELSRRRVDYVHFNDEPVSIGHLNQDSVENIAGAGSGRMIPAQFLRDFRKRYSGSVMICGALTADSAGKMLADGDADLFAFGIPFIANPDLPTRLREDLPLSQPKTELFYGGDAEGYTDYPPYANPGVEANTASDTRSEVLAAAQRLVDCFGGHDVKGYFNGFTPNATFIFYYLDRPLLSRQAYQTEWTVWEEDSGFRVIACRSLNQQVQILGSNVAIFLHDVETDVEYQGEHSTRFERETIVFERHESAWLAVHEHLSLHADV